MIYDYIQITKEFGETKTLLSYSAYKQFVGNDSYNNSTQSFTKQNFQLLLDKYYNEIVEIKYQVTDLERIKPNDTRHFAFCSMMLQGFNALTIARIGGHRSIESQYHYQQHLDYFTQSHVYHLTKINKLRNSKDFRTKGSTFLLQNAEINSLQNINNFDFLEPMEIGYCTDHNMECESDYCQLCSKWYIPREEFRTHHQKLLDFSESYENRIQERLKVMERLRNEMEIDINENVFSPQEQEKLSRESKLLLGDIHDLARLKANIVGQEHE